MARWLALALLLLVTAPAPANWFRSRSSAAPAVAYYPPTVVYMPLVCVAPAMPAMPLAPVPNYAMPPTAPAPARLYATPTPAPPLANPGGPGAPIPLRPQPAPPGEAAPPPAPAPGAPGVTERTSSSYYDAYAAAGVPAAGENCSIGFWNNTPRTIRLNVQGKDHELAAGRGLTLELPRQFVWQVDGRAPRAENLAAAAPALDIVIRR